MKTYQILYSILFMSLTFLIVPVTGPAFPQTTPNLPTPHGNVVPAFPQTTPNLPTPHGNVVPAFPDGNVTPKMTRVLKRRIFLGSEPVAVCDAHPDLAEHQNCYLLPGHTVDDLLDAVTESEPKPCPDSNQNNAVLKKTFRIGPENGSVQPKGTAWMQ